MEAHETSRRGGEGAGTVTSCPLPGVTARPLSWELGERVVADDATWRTLVSESGRTTVSVYEATDHTVVVGVRTPVGRQRYYEVPAASVERAIAQVTDDDAWRVTERDA